MTAQDGALRRALEEAAHALRFWAGVLRSAGHSGATVAEEDAAKATAALAAPPAPLDALDGALRAKDGVEQALVDMIVQRDVWMTIWARGIDANGVWCWCADDTGQADHEASANDADHARACQKLRGLIGAWGGREPEPVRAAWIRHRAAAAAPAAPSEGVAPQGAEPPRMSEVEALTLLAERWRGEAARLGAKLALCERALAAPPTAGDQEGGR